MISKSIIAFLSDLVDKSVHPSFSYQASMASTSGSGSKQKKVSKMLVKGVAWRAPNFKLVHVVTKSLDPHGAQSKIPPKVLLINDIGLISNVLFKK